MRIREAERGRGRAAASGSSSGIGGDRDGFGESGMVWWLDLCRVGTSG